MADMDYKPNSHKFREQQSAAASEKRIEKVVKGSVKVKKKNDLYKVADIFISDDVKNIKEYVLMDVLVPTVKKVIMGTIDMLLNGGSGNYASYSGRSSGSKVSYARYYDDRKDTRRYAEPARSRSRFDHDDIIFETRGEAEAVREEMCNVIDRYGFVTVADMYDMAELSQPYTSEKYGWTNLRTADVVRGYDGYIIKLPKAEPIER